MVTKPSKRLTIAASLLVFSWLAGTGYAFWWFQMKDLGALQTSSNLQQQQELTDSVRKLLPASEQITVVNFWQPDCSCNKFNEKHVNDLVSKHGKQVRFVTVSSANSHGEALRLKEQIRKRMQTHALIDEQQQLANSGLLTAAPTVAIFNKKGELSYFGSFSDGAFCGEGKSFVDLVINNIRQDASFRLVRKQAFGCFCDWKGRTA